MPLTKPDIIESLKSWRDQLDREAQVLRSQGRFQKSRSISSTARSMKSSACAPDNAVDARNFACGRRLDGPLSPANERSPPADRLCHAQYEENGAFIFAPLHRLRAPAARARFSAAQPKLTKIW
jgi:hypothetical protein